MIGLNKLTLLMALVLTACTPYESDLDCGIGEGMRCASVLEVNRAVDEGKFDTQGSMRPKQISPLKAERASKPLTTSKKNHHPLGGSLDGADGILNGARPTRIWIAPRMDQQGHYHSAKTVTLS